MDGGVGSLEILTITDIVIVLVQSNKRVTEWFASLLSGVLVLVSNRFQDANKNEDENYSSESLPKNTTVFFL